MVVFDFRTHLAWAFLFSLITCRFLNVHLGVGTIVFLPLLIMWPRVYMFTLIIGMSAYLFQDATWLFLLGVVLGFDLPDLDATRSWIGARSLGINHIVHKIFKHRGFMHSIPACCVFALMLTVTMAPRAFTISFLAAYLSHLLGDMMYDPGNNGRHSPGIRLFWPSKTRIRFKIFYKHPIFTRLFMILLPISIILLGDRR